MGPCWEALYDVKASNTYVTRNLFIHTYHTNGMVTQSSYAPQTTEQVLEWFPEINDITDEDLRNETIHVVLNFPDYFWYAPAAKRHHPVEHQARHGLVLHTKRVCTTYERLCESMNKQGFLTDDEVNYGRMACIFHDVLKHGEPPTQPDGTVKNHDLLASLWLSQFDLPDKVLGAVESHNGPWYVGKKPTNHLEQIVHMADMMASDPNNPNIKVKDPHPVLVEKFPRVEARE